MGGGTGCTLARGSGIRLHPTDGRTRLQQGWMWAAMLALAERLRAGHRLAWDRAGAGPAEVRARAGSSAAGCTQPPLHGSSGV